MPSPTRSSRTHRPLRNQDVLSLHLDHQMVAEMTTWARRAEVSRSELGRWIIGQMIHRIKRMGRHQLREQILAQRPVETDWQAAPLLTPATRQVSEIPPGHIRPHGGADMSTEKGARGHQSSGLIE